MSTAGIKWRVIRDDPLSGARNMALDHALALTPRPREGVLRLYTWASPTVSFGRNEPAKEHYDRAAGVALLKRANVLTAGKNPKIRHLLAQAKRRQQQRKHTLGRLPGRPAAAAQPFETS